MMEHIADEQLSLYATDDLAPEEQLFAAAHVETCAECRNTVAEFRETQCFLKESLSDPEAADLLEMRQRVAQKLWLPRSGVGRWAWGLAVAAAMLALALVPFRFDNRPTMAPFTLPALPPPQILPLEAPPVQAAALPRQHTHHRDAGIRSVAL